MVQPFAASFDSGQRELLERIASGSPLPEILDGIVRLIECQADGMLCSILLVDREQQVIRTGSAPSLPSAYVGAIDGARIGPNAGSCGAAACRGEIVIAEDIETHPNWADYKQFALPHGLRACWSSPILSPARETLGTFAMYYPVPRGPTGAEMALVEVATHLAAIAIVRDRGEQSLRHSEQRYRQLMEATYEGVWAIDTEGRTTFANRRIADMLGYTPEEMLGRSMYDFMNPSVRDEAARALSRRVTGVSEQQEFRLRRKDGSDLWTIVAGSPIHDERGRVVGALGMITNLTERKAAEGRTRRLTHELGERVKELTVLHRTAHLLQERRAFDLPLLKDLVVLIPGALQYPEVCEARIALDGLEAATAGWKDSPWRLSVALDVGGKRGALEIVYLEERPAEATGPFLREEEELLRSIADMLAAHLGRQQVEDALRQSEERLRAVVETTPNVGIQWYDERGRVLFCNRASKQLFGWTDDRAIGRTLDQLNFSSGEASRFLDVLRGVAASGQPAGPMEFVYRRPDGTDGVLLSTLFSIPLSSAGTCYVCMDVDLTAHRRAEEERRNVEAQLQQAQRIQSLGTLAGGIAHDFNNLLAAISGHTRLALEALPDTHPVRENLSEIRNATRRASEVVRQILTFSRQQEPRPESLRVESVIDEAVRLLRATLPDSIAIRTRFADDTPMVFADSTQLHQVIMNLATNAAHAIGGRPGTIELSSESAVVDGARAAGAADLAVGHYALVAVRDDGAGMDKATLARVFEPFFTTKAAGHGTGLGMSVVHGIMKAHKGAVLVESREGAGTIVRLYFPAGEADRAGRPTGEPHSVMGQGEHIFYVDDEEALVFLAKRVLGRLGYRVTGYSDPVRALEDFRMNPALFDAAVTDMSMPGLSGFHLARGLLGIRPDLPIVMTSGCVTREDSAAAEELGITHVLLKPNTSEELGDILHRLLAGRRAGASR